MVKAVYLDIDGTLMDTNYLHVEAWAQAFEEVGTRPPRSRIHYEVGKGSEKLITEFVEEAEKAERVSELHSEYYDELQERGHPLPGAKELIASLVERGYEVCWPPAPNPRNSSTTLKSSGPRTHRGDRLFGRSRGVQPAPDIFGSPWSGGVSPEDAVVVATRLGFEPQRSRREVAGVMTGGAFSRAELEEAEPTLSTRLPRAAQRRSPSNENLPIRRRSRRKEWYGATQVVVTGGVLMGAQAA